jgi:hypothetical protein
MSLLGILEKASLKKSSNRKLFIQDCGSLIFNYHIEKNQHKNCQLFSSPRRAPGFVCVPDRRRRILLKVILVRRWVTWDSGNLEGEGFGERVGKGEGKGKSARGEEKQGGCAVYIVIYDCVYKRMHVGLNDTSCIYA